MDAFLVLKKEKKIEIPEKINNITPVLDTLRYGFVSSKNGKEILDRDWIHKLPGDELKMCYKTSWDPRETIKNKLGLCVDQSLVTKYLIEKDFKDIPVQLYALFKGDFGHCICTFKLDDLFYYLENAWDKMKGCYGPFKTKEELEDFLRATYQHYHEKDNDDIVEVFEYEIPKEYDEALVLQESCFLNEFKINN